MTDDTTPIATLFERAEKYSKTTVQLFKLNVVDKTAEIVSNLFSLLVVILTVVLSIVITSLGVALWLGQLLGNTFYGFFIVGGAYMLVAIIFHLCREKLLKYPVSNSIIKQMMKQKTI